MLFTRKQVATLLPILRHFVDMGELPTVCPPAPASTDERPET
jgi:hypothetical protein